MGIMNAQIGVSLSGQTQAGPRSRSGREPALIQNNSGRLRPNQVCPKDLPARSVAG
jgi:hypothetical protein